MGEFFQTISSAASGGTSDSLFTILLNLSLSLVLGFVYSYVYSITYTVKKQKRLKKEMQSMQYTILLLTVGGALIWIVVADNLVRAFGLAGALSLIRFRTVLREPMNTIKVFYAIILGMACGVSQYITAVLGTAFICLVLTIVYFLKDRAEEIEELGKIEEKNRKKKLNRDGKSKI
ncbi:MAG: DUF4956 domain-containing protein [Candidatus Cloacimonetes bacterium]|nr:DUF4956 domain-containing protein [Candidatus Cloacimonadota bacterium]